ncbi:hypothetical protein IT072_13550 [Leifsonia sp. ZF2019]|uniref:hypothetical protein n=1 Tax=Leifsonia sp. ZF2019 TaxID=2781978 RepID=UPI001CBBF187|nr:hypothetical protein [Leifsonia sp. ZF2019]UAJ78284.1 hypothetical protein IT072_13550 [Leifsonia sp. ZF2019]
MSYVDFIRDQIVQQLKSGKDGLDWIDQNGPAIIRTAMNVYLDTVLRLPIPGAITDRFADEAIAKLHEATAEIRSALEDAEKGIAYVGSPDRLRAAATAIGDKVIAPSRQLAPQLVLGKLPSTSSANWNDGEASEGYVRAVDGRQEAVVAVDTYANPISSALGDLADAIENYYLAVLAAVVGTVTAILGVVEAIIACVGVVTVPAAVIGIIQAVLGGVAAAIGFYQVFIGAEQSARSITGNLSGTIPAWPRVLA